MSVLEAGGSGEREWIGCILMNGRWFPYPVWDMFTWIPTRIQCRNPCETHHPLFWNLWNPHEFGTETAAGSRDEWGRPVCEYQSAEIRGSASDFWRRFSSKSVTDFFKVWTKLYTESLSDLSNVFARGRKLVTSSGQKWVCSRLFLVVSYYLYSWYLARIIIIIDLQGALWKLVYILCVGSSANLVHYVSQLLLSQCYLFKENLQETYNPIFCVWTLPKIHEVPTRGRVTGRVGVVSDYTQ